MGYFLFSVLQIVLCFFSLKLRAQNCAVPVPLPYLQDFQNITPPVLPPCTVNQTILPSNGRQYWWTRGQTSGNIVLSVNAENPMLRNNHWFYLPLMHFDAARVYQISYKYGSANTDIASAHNLSIYFGMCTSNTCMTNLITTGLINNPPFQVTSRTFAPAAGANYYIGFNHSDRAGFPGNITYLDSIQVQDMGTLPVTVSRLTFSHAHNTIKLYWHTFTEHNNRGFQVEQSSDGRQFRNIGFTASKAFGGNSNTAVSYDFSVPDNVINDGIFFRLQQTDIDGSIRYSSILNITSTIDAQPNVTIIGNPVVSQLSLYFYSPWTKHLQVQIIDNTGRVIMRKTSQVDSGNVLLQIATSGLAIGTYCISLLSSDGSPFSTPFFLPNNSF